MAEVISISDKLVPAGSAWAVGVSGGADSVALLRLLVERQDIALHVVHLDHQTRGAESAADAKFVRFLCGQLNVPCTVALRSEVEVSLPQLPANRSARFRAARLTLFRKVVGARHLSGVLLGHHADDQAETVMLRLLRGAGARGLAGMDATGRIDGLTVCRPLLGVGRAALRSYLELIGQTWREDASNTSAAYLRNRVRAWLRDRPGLVPMLLELSGACRAWKEWSESHAPTLAESFDIRQARLLARPTCRVSLARWLARTGVPTDRIDRAAVDRLLEMVTDASSPAKVNFPGDISVSRTRRTITAQKGRES